MKFRFEILAGENLLADKAEVTVVVWVTPDLGGLQIERQAGVLRMYADEARALDNLIVFGADKVPTCEFEIDYKPA